jgi:predicted small secreted protein
MKRSRRLVVAGLLSLVLVLSVFLAACGSADGEGRAPDFSGTTINGAQVSRGGFEGKPTILVFGASW